ncbi:MAG TPA: hypothetical protein VD866_01950 [Urbifossiella sp.]|nr:hypothetical protein [Urbifossiella sp.]
MTKFIAFTNPDGTVGIITPAPEMFDPKSRTRELLAGRGVTLKTSKQVLDWIAAKDVPAGLPWRLVEAVPADRAFRAAWTGQRAIDVDMTRARAIHLDRLRVVRNEKLKALDVEYQKAHESGDENRQAEVAKRKQELRDLPAAVDLSAVTSPAELKAFVPATLTDREGPQ